MKSLGNPSSSNPSSNFSKPVVDVRIVTATMEIRAFATMVEYKTSIYKLWFAIKKGMVIIKKPRKGIINAMRLVKYLNGMLEIASRKSTNTAYDVNASGLPGGKVTQDMINARKATILDFAFNLCKRPSICV